MNARIKQFEKLSWEFNVDKMRPQFNPDKFARLIIQDCLTICEGTTLGAKKTLTEFTDRKELEPSLVARGAYEQVRQLTTVIQSYFGITHEP